MATPAFQIAAGLGSGLAGGLLAGLFGVGGGIVLVPLLGLFLGLNQHQAQGLTLTILLLPNTLPAVVEYHRRGVPIPWRVSRLLIVAFLPGVYAGARLAVGVPDAPLRMGFALFLLLISARMLFQKKGSAGPQAPEHIPIPIALGIGLLGGLASGFLGIGGGVVMIPLMVFWLRLPQHQAQLASMMVLLPPVGLPGVLVYHRAAEAFPWWLALGLMLGFQGGAYLGALGATRLTGKHLQRGFAAVMALLALLLLGR